jgi:mannose-6-phosphate isomerase-like protein (cupin superfamily)
MAVAAGHIVDERDVVPERAPGDTAEVRTTIDASVGCERLEQRVLRFAPGRSRQRGSDDRQEVLYVVSGRGTLILEGTEHSLEPEMGVFVAHGERYEIDNPGPEELKLVSVTSPGTDGDASKRKVTVRLGDRDPLPATTGREFRYLVNQDAGCLDVTQFVGVIPPGKAPIHHHTYDEVVYVIEGEGIFHIAGTATPMGPGTCIHLPPQTEHALENTGSTPMRVLGVFHPSGDPSKAYTDNK